MDPQVVVLLSDREASSDIFMPPSSWYMCNFDWNSGNYVITMHLLFHSNHMCHQIHQDGNLRDYSCLVLFDFQHWCWFSQMCAPLATCMLTVRRNNANPLICTAFGILFLPVPAWRCSTISGAGCLCKPDSTLLCSAAPQRNGPRLWDPETVCVQIECVLQACLWSFLQCLFKIILLFPLCLCLFYLLFVSTSFIAASCFSSYTTLAFLSLPLCLWLASALYLNPFIHPCIAKRFP